MSRNKKIINRLLSNPKDFTFEELIKVFSCYGYRFVEKAKGSRVYFELGEKRYRLHKPHPDNILKSYQIKEVINYLKKEGKL